MNGSICQNLSQKLAEIQEDLGKKKKKKKKKQVILVKMWSQIRSIGVWMDHFFLEG